MDFEFRPEEVRNRTLRISDLLDWMDEKYLMDCFYRTRLTTFMEVARDKLTGLSEGYGLIECSSHAAAVRILKIYNGTLMPKCGHPFRLSWATFNGEPDERGHDDPNQHSEEDKRPEFPSGTSKSKAEEINNQCGNEKPKPQGKEVDESGFEDAIKRWRIEYSQLISYQRRQIEDDRRRQFEDDGRRKIEEDSRRQLEAAGRKEIEDARRKEIIKARRREMEAFRSIFIKPTEDNHLASYKRRPIEDNHLTSYKYVPRRVHRSKPYEDEQNRSLYIVMLAYGWQKGLQIEDSASVDSDSESFKENEVKGFELFLDKILENGSHGEVMHINSATFAVPLSISQAKELKSAPKVISVERDYGVEFQ